MTTIVSIAQGGTGSNSAALARTALGVPPSAAYDQANTARDQANTARTQANTAYDQANTARTQANTAYGQANAAYGAANTRLSASGGTLSGDLIITGNLTVSGNSTTLNTEILTVEDADIVLLSNVASTPALNAGIIVNRGTSTNTFLRWNEAIDEWGWSDSGTTTYYFEDLRQGLGTINTTFGTTNTTFGTVNTTFATLNTSAGTQNTAITTANDQANSARGQANTGYGQANAAYGQANVAYGQANAAYSAANNRVLKAGDTMTGQLNISAGGLLVTGNVGVGFASPIFPLQIKTNTSATSQALQLATTDWTTTVGSAFQFGFGAATGNTYSEIRALSGGYNAWNNLVLQSGGGSVGIANTNPQGALHVTTSSGYNLYLDKSGGASIQFSRSGTLGYQIDDSSGTIRFLSSGSTPRAVIDSSGNFGIGTTNPSSYGGLVVSGTGYVSHFNATSGAVGFGLYENGTGRFYIKTLNGSDGLAFIDGDGTSERARFTSDGHFRPATDNTYNLGATDYRWANIYTADLNLSNRDSQNDVDGTWGAWTIQEGENDLYLINRRNGKKFKFMLKEVE